MTTVAITTLRTTIATALANPGVWSTFSYVPATPIANSVIVSWDDPALSSNDNSNLTISPTAHFKISMFVPFLDNAGSLANLENFMITVFQKMANSGLTFNGPQISAPAVLNLQSGDLLAADLSIAILTSWS